MAQWTSRIAGSSERGGCIPSGRGGHAAAGQNHVARYDIRLSVHEDLTAIEREWREFEQRADATVFQTYEWLATYQRHIGARRGVRPAVVIARDLGW